MAAIMFTEMMQYQNMLRQDASLAKHLLDKQKSVIREALSAHRGRDISGNLAAGEETGLKSWIKGSGTRTKQTKLLPSESLALFESALDATRCAVEIQRALREYNREAPSNKDIYVRIGIHVGDVAEKDGEVYGKAVNVASRIEPLAEDGGVCLTSQVYDQVHNKIPYGLVKFELQQLKNVAQEIEVYRVVMPWSEPGEKARPPKDGKRIVVLPFANMSGDPRDEFFADGMTEELIAALSKIRGLRVVARTSAMRYKGEKKTVGEIGRELNVGSLLEGSVRKAENLVRINVQLIDADSEEQLWSDKYDRELKDVFAVQSDIAQQVTRALEVKLRDVESSQLAKQQTRNPVAFTLYLRGRHQWNTRLEDGISRAIKYFEEAIARDPTYALAYTGLADCYSMLGLYGHRRPSTVYPTARNYVTKALELDESLAEAHASMGEILMQYYYEWDAAGYELDKALELSPSYATAHLWKSTHLVARGKVDEAIAECRMAEELDPLSLIIASEVGRTFYFARRYEEAQDQYKKALEIDPSFAIAHKGLAEVYSKMSRFEEALVEIQKAIALSKGSIFILGYAGYIFAISGRRAEAEKVLLDLDKASDETYVPPFGRAAIYAGLGDADRAMEWLQKAHEERSFLTWLKVDPVFDGLRTDPRFVSLIKEMGLS